MPQLASASTECYTGDLPHRCRSSYYTDKRFWRAIDRQLKLALDPDVAAIMHLTAHTRVWYPDKHSEADGPLRDTSFVSATLVWGTEQACT